MPNIKDKSLSGLWRANASKDAGVELASILDSCRILAQSLIPGVEVTFAGVDTAQTDRKRIILGTKELGSNYPVDGDTVDVVMGIAVHEIGHALFSPDKAQYTAELIHKGKIFSGTTAEVGMFKEMVNVLEDIYVNHLMSVYPGYSDYLSRERAYSLGQYNPDSIIKPLENKCTRRDMINAIIYCVLDNGKLPTGITQDNAAILSKIIENCNGMVTKRTTKDSAILNTWKTISKLPEKLDDDSRGFTPPPPPEPAKPDDPGDSDQPAPDAKPIADQMREDAENEKQEREKDKPEKTDKPEKEDKPDDTDEKEDDNGEDDGDGDSDDGESDSDTDAEADPEAGDSTDDMDTDKDPDAEAEVEPAPDEPPDIDKELNLAENIDSAVDDKTELDPATAEEVQQAIIGNRNDLSQLVSNLAGKGATNRTVIVYTPKEDASETAEARASSSDAEEKVRRIIQEYRLKRTTDYRGLMSGRVSGRRLSRVAYGDQRVFQRRERPDEVDLAICLLMDMSGSERQRKPLIEQIVCAITDAFQKEKVEFIALGYTAMLNSQNGHAIGQTIKIARLFDHETGKVNFGVDYWGDTPSYEGLAAGIAQLLRLSPNKRKVLIHFTDGQPDSGMNIPQLLEDSRKRGIIDIHIALGNVSGNFQNLYQHGDNVYEVKNISELPEIIEKQLRSNLNDK